MATRSRCGEAVPQPVRTFRGWFGRSDRPLLQMDSGEVVLVGEVTFIARGDEQSQYNACQLLRMIQDGELTVLGGSTGAGAPVTGQVPRKLHGTNDLNDRLRRAEYWQRPDNLERLLYESLPARGCVPGQFTGFPLKDQGDRKYALIAWSLDNGARASGGPIACTERAAWWTDGEDVPSPVEPVDYSPPHGAPAPMDPEPPPPPPEPEPEPGAGRDPIPSDRTGNGTDDRGGGVVDPLPSTIPGGTPSDPGEPTPGAPAGSGARVARSNLVPVAAGGLLLLFLATRDDDK